MATGHVLPAQRGDAVSNLYRVHEEAHKRSQTAAVGGIKQSFIPENNNRRWLLTQAPVASDRLEAIRRQAREMWSEGPTKLQQQQQQQQLSVAKQPPLDQTSYQRHYSAKRLDEPAALRPTSPNRRNNPHPPMVFLTCRLHNVPGFSNPDGSINKAPYKVDASHTPEEQAARQRQRAKFADRPDDGALRQYADKDPIEEVFGQKLEFRVSNLGRWQDDEADEDFAQARKRMTDWQRTARPSLHRYMKYQGPVERDRLGAASGFPPGRQQQQQQQRWQSADYQRGLVYQPTRVRGDYLIHPMWPPTLPHHWVP